jgi:butyryl-CoA dehydrogenase
LIVIEEIAKTCQLAAFPIFEANTGPARVIDLFGSEEQRSRFLPPVIRGEKTIAVAISEADAGSAATDAQTRAHLDGSDLVIDGAKRWCSGAGHAEQYLVYVRLGAEPGAAGLGAVVVDQGTSGLSFGPQEALMGFRGIGSADMFFDNVRVPRENLIVGKGGFKRLFTAFSIERLGNATMSLAIGQSCLDRSVRHTEHRRQFGRELIEFQLVQASLAEMIMQVDAARLLIYRAATNAGRGAPPPLEASIAKCFANEMGKRVSDLAMQLHGGYGYSVEYEIERLHRDAVGWAIAGGTESMQKIRIASEYVGRRFNQRPGQERP